MLNELKQQVFEANLALVKYDLVTLTWGNVSGISREENLVVIKPSGVEYEKLTVNDMVVLDLSGKIIEGNLRPSSDTPTHIELYKSFPSIGGIAHSHSTYATIFAQACKEIPCFGTTHADAFYGNVPLTRFLTKKEVEENYELNTGKAVIQRFKKLDPNTVPGVLVAGHAPFTWGKNAGDAVKNNLMLERIAFMALHSLQLNPKLKLLPKHLLEKHHERKHGPNAYYGQKNRR
ncbi:MAG: L-ribulose-5-phosphate 4-epimerase AraD [Bacteroidota bacterium]|nr:L-ribulose-5-phosphate 4-epimerase AraD [Bacteroidota bacterium]